MQLHLLEQEKLLKGTQIRAGYVLRILGIEKVLSIASKASREILLKNEYKCSSPAESESKSC